ncbi:MAG: hypothetical protein KUG71_08255 [Porticoccaceae bacterium]|nr:hypothetical protein [Porticoccaceae bacterium]
MWKFAATFLLASVFGILPTMAQGAGGFGDKLEISGVLESNLSMSVNGDESQKKEFVLTPELNVDLTPSLHLTAVGRLRGDLDDDLAPGKPRQRNRSAYSKQWFAGKHFDAELREAYIDTDIGDTFLRIGKQQVVWGQADGLKVLDVLNPQSFREFILDDFEDSRIPLWTVNGEIRLGAAFLQLLWIPDQTYDDIPEPGSAFAFTSPGLVPVLPPGVPATIFPVERPSRLVRDSDIGAKLSMFVDGWDLTLNYAYHYFDRPVIRREVSSAGITVRQDYQRTHLFGGTFSNVFNDFTLRGEVGFSSHRYFLSKDTDHTDDRDGLIQSGELSYVLGLDYQGWRDWFISAQIFQSFVTNPGSGLVRDTVDTTSTLLLRRDFMNEAVQAEMLLIQSLNQGDGLVQTSLEYEWRTDIRLRMGADIFYGKSSGLFGQFDERDRLSLGIEIGF